MDNLIIVFLLFAAVLVFGWFYLQRAKARDAGTVQAVDTTVEPAGHDAPPPVDATVASTTTADPVERVGASDATTDGAEERREA